MISQCEEIQRLSYVSFSEMRLLHTSYSQRVYLDISSVIS